MIYAENVYLLLAAPLLVSLLFLRTPGRRFTLFLIVGMSACLLAAYCNTFIAGLTDFDAIDSVVIVAPIVEEIFKFLPLAFQLLVFDPDNATQKGTAIALGIGYATFENACFLSQAGTSELFLVAIRGFAVGAMHIGCATLMGYGLAYSRDEHWPRTTAMLGIIALAITYHGTYNLLVSFPGPLRWTGYALPTAIALGIHLVNVWQRRAQRA